MVWKQRSQVKLCTTTYHQIFYLQKFKGEPCVTFTLLQHYLGFGHFVISADNPLLVQADESKRILSQSQSTTIRGNKRRPQLNQSN
jgi:hypothetical protein